MKIETGFKVLIVIILIIFISTFSYIEIPILGLNLNLVLYSMGLFMISFLIAILVLSEIYTRIQHNIDKRFYYLQKDNNEKFSYTSEIMHNESKMLSNLTERFSNLELLFDLYIKEKSKEALIKIAPDLFKHKTLLYIGANKFRSYFLEDFKAAGYNITLLEAFKHNVEHYKSLGWVDEIIHKDVRNFKSIKKYDVIFWWHGPEHIEKSEIKKTLKNLEKITRKIIVLGCPLGNVMQQGSYGNKFEKHLSFFEVGYFENLGYKTYYIGRRNTLSNITAVKHIK